MDDITWEIAHSVETHAPRAFAWEFMSNVANWNDPPAHFQIDGPFVTDPGNDPNAGPASAALAASRRDADGVVQN